MTWAVVTARMVPQGQPPCKGVEWSGDGEGELVDAGGQRLTAPLIAHGGSDALVGAAAFLPAIRGWRHEVNACFTSCGIAGGFEPGEVVKPEAGGFDFTVSELPRLDDLIRRADVAADHADRVFDAPAGDGCVHEQANEVECIGLFALLAVEVT